MSDQLQFFVSPGGAVIVYFVDIPHQEGDLAYSPNGGATKYELPIGLFGGSAEEHEILTKHPTNGEERKIIRTGRSLSFDGETFEQREAPA